MFLGGGRKLEYPERTHMENMWEDMQTPQKQNQSGFNQEPPAVRC